MASVVKFFIIVVFGLGIIQGLQASDLPADTFKLANDAYENGAVNDAIQLYRAIADRGYESLALYYNLGSAYAVKGNWIDARYFLEKAHLEDPLHRNVNINLDYVKDQIDDPYSYPKYPLFSFVELLHSRWGRNLLSILILLAFISLIISVYLVIEGKLPYGKIIPWSLMVIFCIFGILLFIEQTYERFHSRMVIVRTEETPLFKSPDVESEIAFELKGGHKLRIQETIGPWYQVDLADGTEGWVLAEKVKPIQTRNTKG